MQRPNLPSILDYFCSLRMFCWFLVATYDSESFLNKSSFWPKLGSQGQAVKIKNIQLFGKKYTSKPGCTIWDRMRIAISLCGVGRLQESCTNIILACLTKKSFYWVKFLTIFSTGENTNAGSGSLVSMRKLLRTSSSREGRVCKTRNWHTLKHLSVAESGP